jgi:DNA polymerase-3 subunit epsilon
MTRSVLFDTETTGLEPHLGHRVLEIAALELINDLPTGKHFHALIDPERDVPADAVRLHGFTNAHLAGKPHFAEIAEAMLAFFDTGPLIAHNAPFDFGFLDAELDRLGLPRLEPARMIDTLALARNRFPGMPNSLDALCRRFGIDLSERSTHNALLDCRLLADVYVELTGGRQRGLSLAAQTVVAPSAVYRKNGARTPRPIMPSAEERAAHAAMIGRLTDPVWFQPEPDRGSEAGTVGSQAESG